MITPYNIDESFKFTLDEIKQAVNKDIIQSAVIRYKNSKDKEDKLDLVFKFILTDRNGRKYKTINKAASYTFKLSDFVDLTTIKNK
jgi:hypothetical protein